MEQGKESRWVRCITINTDASFHPTQKVGGYAFHIVCDQFKIKKGGKFKVNPANPEEAELMCMANALYTLLMREDLPATGLIVINNDCLNSFEKVGLRKQGVGRKVAQLLKKVRNRMARRGVILPEYEFRHVKAHSGKGDPRSLVNEWCDQEAKKWMRSGLAPRE